MLPKGGSIDIRWPADTTVPRSPVATMQVERRQQSAVILSEAKDLIRV
jgi:hypothetical protein